MKSLFALLACLFLVSACHVKVGEFTPDRHQMHEYGRPDCEKTPEKCIDGVPW